MDLQRIIINFTQACNMQCPFCYIPFDERRVDFRILERVLEHGKELGVRVITFGGGDPFNYKGFRHLLPLAKAMGFAVHVDTNALGIEPNDIDLLTRNADVIGLPLDGSTPQMQHTMRRSRKNNHEAVLWTLDQLKGSPVKRKVNTVASAINAHDLADIGELVAEKGADVWSLYQFWAVNTSPIANRHYALPDEDFDGIATVLAGRKWPFRFEPGSVKDRLGTYLFVTTSGDTYLSVSQNHQTTPTGSFFGNEWRSALERTARTTIRIGARHRYDLRAVPAH